MSIVIPIQKSYSVRHPTRDKGEDCIPNEERAETINIPKLTKIKVNDLSKLEISQSSSKYTLSGDEKMSNISLDSALIYKHKSTGEIENIFGGEMGENEITVDNKSVHTIKSGSPHKSTLHATVRITESNLISERVCEEINQIKIKDESNE